MIERIVSGRPRDLGGFEVRRVLPAAGRQMVGPFIFFDHIGPADFAPGHGIDVRPHPHIGLATVTYLFEGALVHRDSLGCVQTIEPGDVNWMTAGRGIVHSERTDAATRARGSRIHGIQSWVALPRAAEQADPAFVHHSQATLPAFRVGDCTVRVIAGTAFGRRSPVATSSGTLYADLEMPANAMLRVPAEHQERAIYVAAGSVRIADGGNGSAGNGGGTTRSAEREVGVGSLAVFEAGGEVELRASAPSRVMLLGGASLDGPRYIWWNFVASSRERIEEAKRDWSGQRFAAVPGETEFIPLPDR